MFIHAAVGFFFIMAWITLTTDDIRNRLTECELEAIEETAVALATDSLVSLTK